MQEAGAWADTAAGDVKAGTASIIEGIYRTFRAIKLKLKLQ